VSSDQAAIPMWLEDIATSRLEKWHEVPRWLSEMGQDNRLSVHGTEISHLLLVHAPKMGKGLSLLLSILVLGCLDNNPIHTILDSRLEKFRFHCPRSIVGLVAQWLCYPAIQPVDAGAVWCYTDACLVLTHC
jgi:hypothetical protein